MKNPHRRLRTAYYDVAALAFRIIERCTYGSKQILSTFPLPTSTSRHLPSGTNIGSTHETPEEPLAQLLSRFPFKNRTSVPLSRLNPACYIQPRRSPFALLIGSREARGPCPFPPSDHWATGELGHALSACVDVCRTLEPEPLLQVTGHSMLPDVFSRKQGTYAFSDIIEYASRNECII